MSVFYYYDYNELDLNLEGSRFGVGPSLTVELGNSFYGKFSNQGIC